MFKTHIPIIISPTTNKVFSQADIYEFISTPFYV